MRICAKVVSSKHRGAQEGCSDDKRTKKKQSKSDIRHKEAPTLFLREYSELFLPDLAKRMNFGTTMFPHKEMIALFEEKQTSPPGAFKHALTKLSGPTRFVRRQKCHSPLRNNQANLDNKKESY